MVHDQDIYKNLFYANPFRYRGYYQDSETGFYYCGNRYYDPAIGRFISADSTNTLMNTPMAYTDKNLYAYCDNNPVMRVDNGGEFWDTVFDVVSLCFSVVDVIKTLMILGLGLDLQQTLYLLLFPLLLAAARLLKLCPRLTMLLILLRMPIEP